MPQVKTQNLGKALDAVADKVRVSKEMVSTSKLKKSQKELFKDKVKGIASKLTTPKSMKPLIISKDNHIVDGHHRWAAAIYKWGDDTKIPVHRIHLNVHSAIKMYKMVANSIGEIVRELREAITIPIEIGDTVLGGKFKNKPIVVKSIDKNEKGDITINGKPLLKFRLMKEGNDQLEMMKLLSKAMKAMPGSPKQKKIKQELNKLRIKNGLKPIPESALEEADAKRDYKKEYEKYGKSTKAKKYRAQLNKYNRDKGTYGNGDGKDASHKGDKIVGFEDESKNRGRREKSRLKKEVSINEIPMGDLQKIDTFADKKLNPVDVVITDKHFFDRLNDPRNGKEITSAELIGFFKRLSKHKKDFVEFLNKYNSVVAVDDRTNINIPFMKRANKAIAKTVMRKKDFKTPDQKLDI